MKTIYTNQQEQNTNNKDTNVQKSNKVLKNTLIGIAFIGAALLILGYRLGLISEYAFRIFISWQMLLITIGVVDLAGGKIKIWSIALVVIGVIFLIPRVFQLPINYTKLLLPLTLLLIGLIIVFKPLFTKKNIRTFDEEFEEDQIDYDKDTIRESYIFGGSNLKIKSQNFKGGKIEAIFGGCKIDLTNAQLSTEEKAVLKLEAIFGGFELLVPKEWTVVLQTQSIFGGFAEKNIYSVQSDPTKQLIIKGKVFFGGGEIKRV